MKSFSFKTTYKSKKTKARLGVIHTPHGDIQTPAFVPVGTQATVKSLTPEEIKTVGTQLFFVNTYHMAMRPGIDVVDRLGGLHSFMKSNGPIITDSGGFQVFSLARTNISLPVKRGGSGWGNDSGKENDSPSLVKISEDGVQFRSHWDGAYHDFTPEVSMQYQWKLRSDIHIAFDDCTPYPVTHAGARTSMERTHRWAVRSLEEHKKLTQLCHPREGGDPFLKSEEFHGVNQHSTIDSRLRGNDNSKINNLYQALYGSIQGSVFEDLRKESTEFISSLDTDGIAIGGVAVGESKDEMKHVLDWVTPILPEEKPRHLLGVGEIDDIFMLIEHGIDTFDCVQPTRLARVGFLYSSEPSNHNNLQYTFDINKSIYSEDTQPVDLHCACYTCQTFTRAYIHHLFKVRELLAYRLATIHNLTFIHNLVSEIKKSIEEDRFAELKSRWLHI